MKPFVEEEVKMEKRKQPLVYVWAGWLGVLLYVVTGCGTQPPSLPTTATPDASAQMQPTTVLAQATADVVLNLVGTYAGTYHWHGSSSSSPMRLELTHEEAGSPSGFCILGDRSFPLLEGHTTFLEGSQGEQGFSQKVRGAHVE